MKLGTFASKRLNKSYVKICNGVVTCDQKNLPCFVIEYDFQQRLGDRKQTSHLIKIISNHKPWVILYILLLIIYFISF